MTITRVEAFGDEHAAWLMHVRCNGCGDLAKVVVPTAVLVMGTTLPLGQLAFWGLLEASAHAVMDAKREKAGVLATPPAAALCETCEASAPVEPEPGR